MMFKIVEKKDKKICSAYRCKNKRAPKKKFCNKHHARAQKETNPLGYTFNVIKQNAKRRGKIFTITLEDFKKFCEDTGYLESKGRIWSASSIDRIDSSKGYEPGNLQIMGYSENSSKGNRDDYPF